LHGIKLTLITAFVIAIFFMPAASAQATAARVDVVSGNGQLICPQCFGKTFTTFYPMVVRVTDASGKPIAGKTVTWNVVSITGNILPNIDVQTLTDSNGYAVSRLFQNATGSSSFQPFLQSVINASADSASANFTETVALTGPTFNEQLAARFGNSVLVMIDQ